MAIKIDDSEAKTIPAITLDKLHVMQFAFTQGKKNTTSDPDKFSVNATGKLYGTDEDGNIVYDDEVITVSSQDFMPEFVKYLCLQENKDAETIQDQIQKVIVDVGTEIANGTISKEKLFAYTRMGIALIFEVEGGPKVAGEE